MPQQGPILEAEDGHSSYGQSTGLLNVLSPHGPSNSNDAGVEGEAVDLATLQDHGIEHQLSPWAAKSVVRQSILKDHTVGLRVQCTATLLNGPIL